MMKCKIIVAIFLLGYSFCAYAAPTNVCPDLSKTNAIPTPWQWLSGAKPQKSGNVWAVTGIPRHDSFYTLCYYNAGDTAFTIQSPSGSYAPNKGTWWHSRCPAVWKHDDFRCCVDSRAGCTNTRF